MTNEPAALVVWRAAPNLHFRVVAQDEAPEIGSEMKMLGFGCDRCGKFGSETMIKLANKGWAFWRDSYRRSVKTIGLCPECNTEFKAFFKKLEK